MRKTYSRRSFLTQVVGAGVLAGSAAVAGAQPPSRQMVVDADPSDPAREPPPPAPPARPRTDRDAGPRADAAGLGRPQAGPAPQTSRFVVCPGHPRCRG